MLCEWGRRCSRPLLHPPQCGVVLNPRLEPPLCPPLGVVLGARREAHPADRDRIEGAKALEPWSFDPQGASHGLPLGGLGVFEADEERPSRLVPGGPEALVLKELLPDLPARARGWIQVRVDLPASEGARDPQAARADAPLDGQADLGRDHLSLRLELIDSEAVAVAS